jgi:hypothetical protein
MSRPATLTAAQRDHLSNAADMLALLPIPHSPELARIFSCLATTQVLDTDLAAHACALGRQVHRALLSDTAPDRWLELVATFPEAEQQEIVADLIDHRRSQSAQVEEVLQILATHIPAQAAGM